MQYSVYFLVLQSSPEGKERESEGKERERAGVLLLLSSCVIWLLLFSLPLPRGAMGWSAVCDVAFRGYIHLFLFSVDFYKGNIYQFEIKSIHILK